MKFAYADPPYLGCGAQHYGKHHPDARAWDDPQTHRTLINLLVDEYPDGWALSLHSPSLKTLLPMAPTDVRIAAWVKPYSSSRPGIRVIYGWEPVIFRGGRKGYDAEPAMDWMDAAPVKYTQTHERLIGTKPRKFCRWIFSLLGATTDDTLDDLFPGTGAVAAAWAEWTNDKCPLPQLPLETGAKQNGRT